MQMMEAELDDVITDSDESYYSGHSEDECTIDPLGETAAFQDLRRQAKADALTRLQEGREREEERLGGGAGVSGFVVPCGVGVGVGQGLQSGQGQLGEGQRGLAAG